MGGRPAVVEAVEASEPGLQSLLRDLVSFRTESQAREADPFPEEARRCIGYVSEFLSGLGFEIEGWDVGPSATFPAHPLIVARRRGAGGGRSLAFNAHVDVVPVGDRGSWSQEPFGGDVVDGRLYGRGATDMKGGLAAAMWAVKVALEQGLEPRGDIVFHVVSDEEVVGNGTREIVERSPACDVTLSLEPTELRLCAAEGGLVHFRIEVEGVEAHASTRYLSVHAGGKGGGGVNAIEKTIKIIQALQELERQWAIAKSHPILPAGYDTLAPAIIVGGPGGGRTAASTCSRTPARHRTTARSSTTCGSTPTSRTRTSAPRSRRSSPRSAPPTRGCASTRRGSPGSWGTSISRRSTSPSTTRP